MKTSLFSKEKLPINTSDLEILKALLKEDRLNEKTLSKRTHRGVGTVSKSLKKLSDIDGIGWIYCIKDTPSFFCINPIRREEIETIVNGIEYGKSKAGKNLIFGHALAYEMSVEELPKRFTSRLKKEGYAEYFPLYWKGIRKKDIDNTIEFHKSRSGNKLIIHIRAFGTKTSMINMIATQRVLLIKNKLEEDYPGIKLGGYDKLFEINYSEYAFLLDPISILAIKKGIKHVKIEDSLKVGGEWEEKGFDSDKRIERIIELRELSLKLDDTQLKRVLDFLNTIGGETQKKEILIEQEEAPLANKRTNNKPKRFTSPFDTGRPDLLAIFDNIPPEEQQLENNIPCLL